jgi:hypothetical protein
MAEKWIQSAIKHPGALTRKAKAAGESLSEYEAKVKKKGSDFSTQTKRQVALAITLKRFHHH